MKTGMEKVPKPLIYMGFRASNLEIMGWRDFGSGAGFPLLG